MFTADHLATIVRHAFWQHDKWPRKPEKAFRKFDGRTPYGIHPTLMAMLLLHEEALSEDLRVRGATALLAHDFLEDTVAGLPDWARDVESLVLELTFSKDEDAFVTIWERSKEAILLKFYDVTANLMCVGKMDSERIRYRREQTAKHLAWVEEHYPGLEIVKIARGLLGKSPSE